MSCKIALRAGDSEFVFTASFGGMVVYSPDDETEICLTVLRSNVNPMTMSDYTAICHLESYLLETEYAGSYFGQDTDES